MKVVSIIRSLYNRLLRDHLPKRIGSFEGVAVRRLPWLDSVQTGTHETALCEAIDAAVEPSDRVLLLGAGWGVSTVHASIMAGQDGHVHVVDAVSESLSKTQQTIDYNFVPSDIELTHGIVGEYSDWSCDRFGNPDTPQTLSPADLPSCDVLVMDIEGAEKTVLSELEQRPREIVVESHGFLNSPTANVVNQLENLDYSTNVVGAEDMERDVYIVHAVQNSQL